MRGLKNMPSSDGLRRPLLPEGEGKSSPFSWGKGVGGEVRKEEPF